MKQDLCVFVVDDMPLVAYTVSAALREEGHSAIPYTDPTFALRDARSFMPDALISDVEMPELGGVDLAIQVLALCPQCKVLLMTGTTGPIKSLEQAQAKGFHFPLFRKPMSARALVEELEAFCYEQPEPMVSHLEQTRIPLK